MKGLFRKSILISLFLALLVFSLQIPLITVEAASSSDDQYAVRKVIRKYVAAMNAKSVEDIVSLYTSDGKYVDESFDTIFYASELPAFYSGIFERSPRITFTAFPWKIEITSNNAYVTCSWSLVADYGVYNGIYWISMSKIGSEWKISEITAYITVMHYYAPPYVLFP